MKIGSLAFILFHATVPVLCVALYGASPYWIVGSLLFSVAVIMTVQYSNAPLVKIVLCMLSGLAMWLALMLGTSYYTQGTGFNDQYFYHLDTETLAIAARAYGAVFFPAVGAMVIAFIAPLFLYRKKPSVRPGGLPVFLLWVAALLTFYPVYSYINYRVGHGDGLSDMMPQVPSGAELALSTKAVTQSAPANNQIKKNIIIIYAEGLEQLYFDQSVFGDILPNIRELSKQAYQFTNVYQVRGATWTIAGIVASQCGFPLVVENHLASNSTMASTQKPFENEECLGDILLSKGYETVYLGGAPLGFAGKGNFLRTHGYKTVLGKQALTPLLPDPDYNMGWGLYDDSLFEIAINQLKSLEDGDSPYLLTLLTLDTHHPNGHPSYSCKSLKDFSDPISNAVYCSDQLISKFIKEAMEIAGMDDTVIVLFSDHLAMRNTAWNKLRSRKKERRLTWMIFDNQPGVQSDQVATHFDFAPTVLEKAGISGHNTLNQGVSLFSQSAVNRRGKPAKVDAAQVPRSLVSDATVKRSGFGISYKDLTISIGDLSLKASENGWPFSSGLFLVILDESGKVTDTIFSEDFAQLQKELEGKFVVGISIQEKDSIHDDQFFYGRMTQDLDKMNIQPLQTDVQIDATHLDF